MGNSAFFRDSSIAKDSIAYAVWISKRSAYILWIVLAACICLQVAFAALKHRLFRSSKRSNILTWFYKWSIAKPFTNLEGKSQSRLLLLLDSTPTNCQIWIVVAYVLSNILLCAFDYSVDRSLEALDSAVAQYCKLIAIRTGILAFANLPLVIMLGMRNNPLFLFLNIKHQTWNLLHRWAGRVVLGLSCAHTICYLLRFNLLKGSGSLLDVLQELCKLPYFQAGVVAVVAALVLIAQSVHILRHLFYSVFIWLHIICALAFMVGSLLHGQYATNGKLELDMWLYAGFILLGLDVIARISQVLFYNVSGFRSAKKFASSATLTTLADELTQVEIEVPRRGSLQPGQTVRLRFPRLSWDHSHPFTIMSLQHKSEKDDMSGKASLRDDEVVIGVAVTSVGHDKEEEFDKEDVVSIHSASDTSPEEHSEVDASICRIRCMIKARRGFTRRLYQHVMDHHGLVREPVLIEANLQTEPYRLDSYHSLILIAAGVGITAILPVLRKACLRQRPMASIRFSWIVRSPLIIEAVQSELDQMIHSASIDCQVEITIYVTFRESCNFPTHGPHIVHRRPQMREIVLNAAADTVGKTATIACGPRPMLDEIRLLIANEVADDVDYYEESS